MLAEWDHGTRLWTLDGFGILRDKTDLIAEREIVELAICDAVAVELEFIAVGAQDEAAILLGEEPRDPSMVGHRVQLDISPSLANVVFEQPAGCVEGVADRHVDVLMGMVCRGIAATMISRPWTLRSIPTRNRLPRSRRGRRHSTTTRHDVIRSQNRSSSSVGAFRSR